MKVGAVTQIDVAVDRAGIEYPIDRIPKDHLTCNQAEVLKSQQICPGDSLGRRIENCEFRDDRPGFTMVC